MNRNRTIINWKHLDKYWFLYELPLNLILQEMPFI
jgi:hypothetical protein